MANFFIQCCQITLEFYPVQKNLNLFFYSFSVIRGFERLIGMGMDVYLADMFISLLPANSDHVMI